MIIPNATISAAILTLESDGIDPATGFPIAPITAWSEPQPCQIVPIEHNAQALSMGEPLTLAHYHVLLPLQDFTAGEVRINAENEAYSGAFAVRHIETLRAVQQLRLWL